MGWEEDYSNTLIPVSVLNHNLDPHGSRQFEWWHHCSGSKCKSWCQFRGQIGSRSGFGSGAHYWEWQQQQEIVEAIVAPQIEEEEPTTEIRREKKKKSRKRVEEVATVETRRRSRKKERILLGF